jgi:hypothetical protein
MVLTEILVVASLATSLLCIFYAVGLRKTLDQVQDDLHNYKVLTAHIVEALVEVGGAVDDILEDLEDD